MNAVDALRSILFETTHRYQFSIVIKHPAAIESVNYRGSLHFIN